MKESNGQIFFLENWGHPPQNRRSYQLIQSLHPIALFSRASVSVIKFGFDIKGIFGAVAWGGLE